MKAFVRAGLAAGTVLAGLAPAIYAHAGGTSGGCSTCNVPKPCDCNVPTGHTVMVPGVNITPPSITVNAPNIWIAAPNVEVQSASVSYASSSASASSDAQASASGYAQGNAYANALAFTNAQQSFALGGGSNYYSSEGASSYIPNLQVEGEAPEARRICAEFRATPRVVAIQAVCLDDKAIPHPASQVIPDRDLAANYEGEVFRCIAGARMQYTLADYTGAADFTRGQTVSCVKGDALYHSAAGQLACRPQRPARDCNERSLLRRYGAGIKVMKMGGQQCVAYRTAASQSSAPGAMVLDGGVGGVVH